MAREARRRIASAAIINRPTPDEPPESLRLPILNRSENKR